jgi:CRP-like cAMP-binding protein
MPFRKKSSDAAERLASIELFEGFSPEELKRVGELVDEVDADEGAELTEQGKPGQEAYVIVSGTASVVIGSDVVTTLGPGELVGEMSLIDNRPRSATVRADTPMKLLALDVRSFKKLLDELPAANRAVMAKLTERIRKNDNP